MDFDFQHITVPFSMQPGLVRMEPGARHLTQLDPGSDLYQEKLSVSRASACLHCVPGFDPSDGLRAVRQHADTTGVRALLSAPMATELAFEEDLALLDAATGSVPWMCVCVPSHWAPEDKIGKSLAAIHAPVADSAALNAALPHLMTLVCGGSHWERFVWTLSPSPRYDQHPRRRPSHAWPTTSDPAEFAAGCYLRAERQTFMPVHDELGRPMRQAVFTIRVIVEALTDVIRGPEQAQRLHDALQSMSSKVLGYKNLATARTPLLAWLSDRQADTA